MTDVNGVQAGTMAQTATTTAAQAAATTTAQTTTAATQQQAQTTAATQTATATTAQAATQAAATTATQQTQTAQQEDIASILARAIEERTKRAENSVAKSFAAQYGLSEPELAAVLEAAKAQKAAQLPEEAQRQIAAATERANNLMIAAEVRALGAQMGLIDAETALLLLDKTGVKVTEGGAVEGAKEALEALKTSKPYLFGQAGAAAWSQKQASAQTGGTVSRAAQIAAEYHKGLYGEAPAK